MEVSEVSNSTLSNFACRNITVSLNIRVSKKKNNQIYYRIRKNDILNDALYRIKKFHHVIN